MMSLTTLCYIEQDNHYLMLHRNVKEHDINKGKWIGVGGKLEMDESPEECLLREVREETGLILNRYKYHGIVTFVSDECDTIYMFLYTADRFEGELIDSCMEGELRWVKKTELFKLSLWEGDAIFLSRMQKSDKPFSLKLCYRGDELSEAVLDGNPLIIPKIRKAEMKDLKALSKVEQICFSEAERASEKSMRDRLRFFSNQFLILEHENEVVGFINGMATDNQTISDEMFENASLHNSDGKWLSVFGLDVLPEFRKHGYGAKLMNAFIRHAREEGRLGVILTCKKPLIPYYEKFGYRNRGISKSVHGNAVWYDMVFQFDAL